MSESNDKFNFVQPSDTGYVHLTQPSTLTGSSALVAEIAGLRHLLAEKNLRAACEAAKAKIEEYILRMAK